MARFWFMHRPQLFSSLFRLISQISTFSYSSHQSANQTQYKGHFLTDFCVASFTKWKKTWIEVIMQRCLCGGFCCEDLSLLLYNKGWWGWRECGSKKGIRGKWWKKKVRQTSQCVWQAGLRDTHMHAHRVSAVCLWRCSLKLPRTVTNTPNSTSAA